MKQIGNIIVWMICLMAIMISCSTNSSTKIETENLNQEQIDSLKRIECDSLLSEMNKTDADTFRRAKGVPTNFEESLQVLDSMMNPQLKEWIRCLPDGDFSMHVHKGLGMHLRNNWGLWDDTELKVNLYQMRILHPDDMTGIILDSYQRKLKGEEVRLDEQLKYHQNFWRKSGVPVDSILNEIEKDAPKNGH